MAADALKGVLTELMLLINEVKGRESNQPRGISATNVDKGFSCAVHSVQLPNLKSMQSDSFQQKTVNNIAKPSGAKTRQENMPKWSSLRRSSSSRPKTEPSRVQVCSKLPEKNSLFIHPTTPLLGDQADSADAARASLPLQGNVVLVSGSCREQPQLSQMPTFNNHGLDISTAQIFGEGKKTYSRAQSAAQLSQSPFPCASLSPTSSLPQPHRKAACPRADLSPT